MILLTQAEATQQRLSVKEMDKGEHTENSDPGPSAAGVAAESEPETRLRAAVAKLHISSIPSSSNRDDPLPEPYLPSSGGSLESRSYSSASLYVGDLRAKVDKAQLLEAFSSAGEIAQIRVVRDTSATLRYAYVDYVNSEDADRAMEEMNKKPEKDRPCRIIMLERHSPVVDPASGPTSLIDPSFLRCVNQAMFDTPNENLRGTATVLTGIETKTTYAEGSFPTYTGERLEILGRFQTTPVLIAIDHKEGTRGLIPEEYVVLDKILSLKHRKYLSSVLGVTISAATELVRPPMPRDVTACIRAMRGLRDGEVQGHALVIQDLEEAGYEEGDIIWIHGRDSPGFVIAITGPYSYLPVPENCIVLLRLLTVHQKDYLFFRYDLNPGSEHELLDADMSPQLCRNCGVGKPIQPLLEYLESHKEDDYPQTSIAGKGKEPEPGPEPEPEPELEPEFEAFPDHRREFHCPVCTRKGTVFSRHVDLITHFRFDHGVRDVSSGITHCVEVVPVNNHKRNSLLKYLTDTEQTQNGRSLIFTNTMQDAETLAAFIRRSGWLVVLAPSLDTLLLGMGQRNCAAEAEAALHEFESGRSPSMIVTDETAHALFLDNHRGRRRVPVSHVVNFDVPNSFVEVYYPRRLAYLSDAHGVAITLFSSAYDRPYARDLVRLLQSHQQVIDPQLIEWARRPCR